jgi:hypothetical protein
MSYHVFVLYITHKQCTYLLCPVPTDCLFYTSLCTSLINSVRDFEEGPMKAVQSLMRKRLKLRERRAQLEAQLDHAKSRDFNGPLDKVRTAHTSYIIHILQCTDNVHTALYRCTHALVVRSVLMTAPRCLCQVWREALSS